MIVSYDSTNDLAKVTTNEKKVKAITVVVVQTGSNGDTIGMAYGAKVKSGPALVANSSPAQYEFTMKLTVSPNTPGFVKNVNAAGYAFGEWGDGSVFSWPSDVVQVV